MIKLIEFDPQKKLVETKKMKEQKFLIVDTSREINDWLDKGWEVISVTPQIVSAGQSYYQGGKWAVVIQKQK